MRVVRSGSWLCENANTLERDRTIYSSKTVAPLNIAIAFDLDGDLENVILVVVLIFLVFCTAKGQSLRT
jgi:hypothetical protein